MSAGSLARVSTAACVAAILAGAGAARALDPFEVQVYDPYTLDPGNGMLELHAIGRPSLAGSGIGPAHAPLDPGFVHLALEPQAGIAQRFEVGAYFETSIWPDGSTRVEGGKLRLKWHFAPETWPVDMAVNVEVGRSDPISGEPVWAGELRPILWKQFGRCRAGLNPIVGFGFAPLAAPTFEPAAKLNCEVVFRLAPGLEYYGDLGPASGPQGGFAPLAQEQHFLFYTLDVYRWPKVEVNLGVGEPLTRASGPWVLNANLGWQFP